MYGLDLSRTLFDTTDARLDEIYIETALKVGVIPSSIPLDGVLEKEHAGDIALDTEKNTD